MTENNQKIIFNIPGDATSAEIMIDVLKKNGVEDAQEDLVNFPENSKLLFFSNTIKDFFDKKLAEENCVKALQDRLQITKENAMGILNDAKKNLLPYAQKIIVGEKIQINEDQNVLEQPAIKKPEAPIKKKFVEKKEPQNYYGRPDSYREPIE